MDLKQAIAGIIKRADKVVYEDGTICYHWTGRLYPREALAVRRACEQGRLQHGNAGRLFAKSGDISVNFIDMGGTSGQTKFVYSDERVPAAAAI